MGCYTDGVANCRTCYLSREIYMNRTATPTASMPAWVDCPCCVTTTLEAGHHDLEVGVPPPWSSPACLVGKAVPGDSLGRLGSPVPQRELTTQLVPCDEVLAARPTCLVDARPRALPLGGSEDAPAHRFAVTS